MTCTTCQHNTLHGWNGLPTGMTHCRDCHATWTGHNRNHCTICHQTFNSEKAGNRHWTRNGHTHPADIPSLHQDQNGYWRTASADANQPFILANRQTG